MFFGPILGLSYSVLIVGAGRLMAFGLFDPTKFINREFEQELFEGLLRFEDEARILAIQDGGGMGKSQLLHVNESQKTF